MKDLVARELNPLKILHHAERLAALARGEDVAPVTVEIDPVAYCNHDCGWCVDPVHTPARMDVKTFERIVAELAELEVGGFRVEGIVLKGGGEPTLHPDFGSFVEIAAKGGLSIGLVTNGSRLARWSGVLARHAAYVRVSIDGPTPESHRAIHRSGDFHDVVDGVERLVAARGEQRHPTIGASFAMDIHTAPLAPTAILLGERMGADYVLLRPPFFEEVGRVSTMTAGEAEETRSLLRAAGAAYEGPVDVLVGEWRGDAERPSGRDVQPRVTLPFEHRTGRCHASPLLAAITAEGELYGCCNLRALPAWSFGRIDYERGIGIAELWSGAGRRAVLERMQRTECIAHCTHRLSRYNEMIAVLADRERPHSQFV